MDRERIRRRYLPHWDVPGAADFVTTCLADSIPSQGLLEISRHRLELERAPKPTSLSDEEWNTRRWKRSFAVLDSWLDQKPARRDLADPALADVVVKSLFHFAGGRYDLLAYVVMPSHLHWLFQPRLAWVETLPKDDRRSPRERIVYSTNRFTATACNRIRGVHGPFWQTESYDHWVRDADEMERIIRYIEENPVKARLVEQADQYRFSSAYRRKLTQTPWGSPLLNRGVS